MRNWKVELVNHIIRGQWCVLPSYALAAGAHLDMLLNHKHDLADLTKDILVERGPFTFNAYQSNAFQANSSDLSGSFDQLPKGSIVKFGISGTTLKGGTMCTYGTEEIGAQMMEAANHKNVGGALLVLDSGGGGVNSIAPISQALQKFKALGKPTLAHVDACYSAAYWMASECPYIMLSNDISAGCGSIGVMASFVDVKPFYEAAGYKFHTIYAPESTEKNLPFELALEGKYDLIKNEELSPLAQNFIKTVKLNRGDKLQFASDDKILKGKTYGAELSVANGLADGIGTLDDAVEMLFALMAAREFVNNK